MLISGENYVYTPKAQGMSFVFEDLYVDQTGIAEFGFSGGGSKFYFLISGDRLLDPSNNFVYLCPPKSPITVSGDFNGSKYRYYINQSLSSDGKNKAGFSVEKFYAKTTDCRLDMGLQMMCPSISYAIQYDETFQAGKYLDGKIFNYSNIDFDILGSRISHDDYVANFTGNITGVVPANGNLSFRLWDVTEFLTVSEADATLELATTIGNIEYDISPIRTSGFVGNTVLLNIDQDDSTSIIPYFHGSGDCKNFTWLRWPAESKSYLIDYSSLDEKFEEIDKPLLASLKNISPANQSVFTGTYVNSYFVYDPNSDYCTGENASLGCSDSQYTTPATCQAASETWGPLENICKGEIGGSGRYSGAAPDVEFLTYKNVTGVTFNSNNIFSSGTPSKIPMLFSGYPNELGTGAAGYFLTEPFQINLGGDAGCGAGGLSDYVSWKKIVGYEMTDFGTGYTKMPMVFATTGHIHSCGVDKTYEAGIIIGQGGLCSDPQYTTEATCGSNNENWIRAEDVAYSTNVYTFSRFQAEPAGDNLAAFLTGLPHFVSTGDSVYGLSGILITNPGSGYDPDLYVPRIRATRQSIDSFGEGGTCSDAQYTTKSTCEAAGTCSDSQYATKESCENASATWTPKVWADGGDNFSGEFFFNKSGTTYNFTDVWNLETGLSTSESATMTGADFKLENYIINNEEYFHSGLVLARDTNFWAKVTFNNLDIDEPIEAKLTISGESQIYEETISIENSYFTETGMAWVTDTKIGSSAGTSFLTNYFS